MKGVKPLTMGLGFLLSAVPTWFALGTFRETMIVTFGIIAANTIRSALLGTLVAVGSVSTAGGLYQLVPAILKSSSEDKLRKSSLAYRSRTSGPREIREQLKIMKESRPRLSNHIARCLEQMDDMVSQFDRFDRLIGSNEAEAVAGARVGLEEIESTLCANFKWVINSIIAADDDETPDTNAFYDQCIERIDRVVTANARALDKGNSFLLEIADNVSQVAGDTTVLDAWLATIRAQNKKSLIGTEERDE